LISYIRLNEVRVYYVRMYVCMIVVVFMRDEEIEGMGLRGERGGSIATYVACQVQRLCTLSLGALGSGWTHGSKGTMTL
jgi:hypothetical protein